MIALEHALDMIMVQGVNAFDVSLVIAEYTTSLLEVFPESQIFARKLWLVIGCFDRTHLSSWVADCPS